MSFSTPGRPPIMPSGIVISNLRHDITLIIGTRWYRLVPKSHAAYYGMMLGVRSIGRGCERFVQVPVPASTAGQSHCLGPHQALGLCLGHLWQHVDLAGLEQDVTLGLQGLNLGWDERRGHTRPAVGQQLWVLVGPR